MEHSRRTLVMDSCVTDNARRVLELGPGFVPSTGKLTSREKSEVVTSVERMAYTLRWQQARPQGVDQPEDDHDTGTECDRRLWKLKKHGFKQPPRMSQDGERKMANFKDEVLAAYGKQRPPKHNMTQEERDGLRELRHDPSVVIKQSDKSKKLVAMKQELYLEKAEALLSDSTMYRKVDLTITAYEKEVKSILEEQCTNMDPDLLTAILPHDTRFPELYGLPKDHKQNLPLRPVVSACDSPVTGISVVLERILHQLLAFVPSHLINTKDALDNIRTIYPGLKAPAGTILATMDVVGLYPSIPIEEGVNAVSDVLEQHYNRVDMLGLSVTQVRTLLKFVLGHNFFRFGRQIYHQLDGVAMGNNLAPPFAILFMHTIETRLLQDSPFQPILFRRYIDDIIILWTHGRQRLLELIERFNASHERIKFTHELSCDSGCIDYMDVTIAVGQTGELSFKLFQKACSSGLLVDYSSAVPHHIKLAVAQSQFLRAQRLSSNPMMQAESEQKIHKQLRINNYPDSIISEAREAARKPRRRRRGNPRSAFLKLPFKSDEVHHHVNKAIRKYKLPVRVVYEHSGSLRRQLCRSALLPPKCVNEPNITEKRRRGRPLGPCITCQSGGERVCMKKNVVYELQCKWCRETYVGETERSLETRIREHNGEARRRTLDKPWGDHVRDKHSGESIAAADSVFSAVSVLARAGDRASRKLREAVEIRNLRPQVNTNAGWALL